MFPLYDSERPGKIPYVNYLLILINIIVFFIEISQPDVDKFIYEWGFIPALFNSAERNSFLYVVTSMFMHGSWFHIISNLWFLHLFGDNVEDRLGHLGYLIFYITAGAVATFVQYNLIKTQNIPLIGASGAISGVAGFYLIYQARSTIVSLFPLGIFITTVRLPAWFFLGYWILLQLIQGFASIGDVQYDQGGIAWFAHIGGFIFGIAVGLLLSPFLARK